MPPSHKHYESIGHEFFEGRAERITELLKAKFPTKVTIADMQEIQTDELDVTCVSALPVLLSLIEKQHIGYKILENWDCVFRTSSTEATLYTRWIDLFSQRLLQDDSEQIANELNKYIWYRYAVAWLIERILDPEQGEVLGKWCDVQSTAPRESCKQLLLTALEDALKQPVQRWGEVHTAQFSHAFSELPGLGRLFHRTQEVGGTDRTVIATTHMNNGNYETVWGPSLRMLFDLGNSTENYWILSTVSR